MPTILWSAAAVAYLCFVPGDRFLKSMIARMKKQRLEDRWYHHLLADLIKFGRVVAPLVALLLLFSVSSIQRAAVIGVLAVVHGIVLLASDASWNRNVHESVHPNSRT